MPGQPDSGWQEFVYSAKVERDALLLDEDLKISEVQRVSRAAMDALREHVGDGADIIIADKQVLLLPDLVAEKMHVRIVYRHERKRYLHEGWAG